MAESGLEGYEMVNWWGFFGPAGMSPELVTKLNTALRDVLKEAGTRERLAGLGYEITGTSAEEFKTYLAAEIEKWAGVIKVSQ
jgi:tripartite-type tricarboxylate transporter receptor subunit TctC